MPELDELMNDIPPSILGDGEGIVENDDPTPPAADEPDEGDEPGEEEEPIDDNEPDEGAEEDEGSEEDEPDEGGDEPTDEEDDYITSIDDEEEPPAPAAPDKPADGKPAATENSYILENLTKIAVRVLVPGAKEGDPAIEKTVEVYGYGDLPRDYLGFASQYEAGVFNQAVISQENRARELQNEFRNSKMQSDMADYTRKENKAIADDLTDLRREGLFPKFKGTPGSKEFNDSEGAKEFDKVVAFMNDRNRQYQRVANNGGAYRHIGFREAYDMLHGPNEKTAQKSESASRRAAAKRLTTSRGTKAGQRNVSSKPVTDLKDLEEEFASFSGQGGGKK